MNKLILYFLFLILSVQYSMAQDSTIVKDTVQRMIKPGIYKTYQEFINNNPSITKAFKLVPDYSIDYEIKDTIWYGTTYTFLDSSNIEQKIWGLCDGKDIYFIYKAGLLASKTLVKSIYPGRYPFIGVTRKNILLDFTSPLSLITVAAASFALSPKLHSIFYFDKTGNLTEAASYKIGIFLKKDKELFWGFQSEKTFTNAVYMKYLIKMNEKYPL